MGMVAVDRGRADMAAIAEVVRLLREGEVVGVFPEGTRSTTGFLYRFRSGLGRMAAAAQAPVVPVGLLGTALVWPRGQPMPRQRPPAGILEVRFGSILGPPTTAGASRRAFTAAVRAAVAEICEQPMSDDYAEIPTDTGRGS
jgi:1-acyl-sn-glycerol-3-phosphate acyltransferase